MGITNGVHFDPEYKLGKRPAMARPSSLMFANYVNAAELPLPSSSEFWVKRAAFPLGTWGNNQKGNCTIASQVVMAMRLNRLEDRQTPQFTDTEALRVYDAMSLRLYGGGDNGAYEEDALSNWRKPDLTFRDTYGRPHTIDAYTRLDPKSIQQIKAAIWLGGSHGIKLCLALPLTWRGSIGRIWDTPADGRLINDWQPYSWGGHSMYADDYDADGVYVQHTWGIRRQLVTWRAIAAYCDEAHSIIDSVNTWGSARSLRNHFDLPRLIDDVNQVSSQKLVA
jgi:hypothetical protein